MIGTRAVIVETGNYTQGVVIDLRLHPRVYFSRRVDSRRRNGCYVIALDGGNVQIEVNVNAGTVYWEADFLYSNALTLLRKIENNLDSTEEEWIQTWAGNRSGNNGWAAPTGQNGGNWNKVVTMFERAMQQVGGRP